MMRMTSGRVRMKHAPADFCAHSFFGRRDDASSLLIRSDARLLVFSGITIPLLTATARVELFTFGFRERPRLAP